jgi:hypothetical protein
MFIPYSLDTPGWQGCTVDGMVSPVCEPARRMYYDAVLEIWTSRVEECQERLGPGPKPSRSSTIQQLNVGYQEESC